MRLLIVEDNRVLLAMIADSVEAAGHRVVGKAQSVERGLILATKCKCDAVILDVDLHGEHSAIIADRLKERGVPFLFTTGSVHQLAPAHRNEPFLIKPFQVDKLLTMIAQLASPRIERPLGQPEAQSAHPGGSS